MSIGYGSSVTVTKGITVPPEFTLSPSLVDVLTAFDGVQHPVVTADDAPARDIYGNSAPRPPAPADQLRSFLVDWHNQLVTAQRAKSDADQRALEQQKLADSRRREVEGLQLKVAEMNQGTEALQARVELLESEIVQWRAAKDREIAAAAEARAPAGRKSARMRKPAPQPAPRKRRAVTS